MEEVFDFTTTIEKLSDSGEEQSQPQKTQTLEEVAEEFLESEEEHEEEEEEHEEEEEESSEEEEEESEEEEAQVVQFTEQPYPDNPPVSYEQAIEHFKNEVLRVEMEKRNIAQKDIQAVLDKFWKDNPRNAQAFQNFIDNKALELAQNYQKEYIEPYYNNVRSIQINNEMARLSKTFPDIVHYWDDMIQLVPELMQEQPQLFENPVRTLPLLYLMAKEMRLAPRGKEKTERVRIEKSTTSTPKSRRKLTRRRSQRAEQDELDAVFGGSIYSEMREPGEFLERI